MRSDREHLPHLKQSADFDEEDEEPEKCCTSRWFWNNKLMKYEDKSLNHVRAAGCISDTFLFFIRVLLGGYMIMDWLVYFGTQMTTWYYGLVYFTIQMVFTTAIYYILVLVGHAVHFAYGPH